MNTLILDTSSENRILCLKTADGVFNASSTTGFVHSSTLLADVDRILCEAGISVHDLSLIGCGIGPGSFTGVRIALTTVRMISQMVGMPLVGIRSHRLYVFHPRFTKGDKLLVAYDAKKKRVFGALYEIQEEGSFSVLVEEGDYPVEQLIASLTPGRVYGAGSGCVLYANALAKIQNYEFLTDHLPDAENVCNYARKLFEEEGACNYKDLLPFYARLSDAEVMKKQRTKNNRKAAN